MRRETEERHIDGSLEDGLVEQVDSGHCKHCGFSYNTDYGNLDRNGDCEKGNEGKSDRKD